MKSRIIRILSLVGISTVLFLAPGAEAHLRIIGGIAYWHSVECSLVLAEVGDPAIHPATTECELTITAVDTLCAAPKNPNLLPGSEAAGTNVLAGRVALHTVTRRQKRIKKEDLTGEGQATVNIDVVSACPASPGLDDACLLGLKSAVCANSDWSLVDIIVRETAVTFKAYQCGDDDCTAVNLVLTSTAEYNCVLPADTGFTTNRKQENPYDCTLISSTHVR